jgi:Protein of unknown function (DUF3122)
MMNKRKFIGVVVGRSVYADATTMVGQAFSFSKLYLRKSMMFKKSLSRLLLALTLSIVLFFGICQPTIAAITQIEEYPGQMLYQSRQNLQDRTGKAWQAIVFKRVHPEGTNTVSLRLISFPGVMEFDHNQPLTLLTSLGKALTANDISNNISQDNVPPPNVAEYDIKAVLPQLKLGLKDEKPIQLTLPVTTGTAIKLEIPSTMIQEWQTLSAY